MNPKLFLVAAFTGAAIMLQRLCSNVRLQNPCGREQGDALHSVLMLLLKHNPAEGLFSTAEFSGGLAECAGSEGTNAIVWLIYDYTFVCCAGCGQWRWAPGYGHSCSAPVQSQRSLLASESSFRAVTTHCPRVKSEHNDDTHVWKTVRWNKQGNFLINIYFKETYLA